MVTPENCAACPLQCQIAERLADGEIQVMEAQIAVDALVERQEQTEIATDAYQFLLTTVEESRPDLSEDVAKTRLLFEFNRRLTQRLLRLRVQPHQEQIAWTQYGIDGLQDISRSAAASCRGTRQVLVPGAYYFDGKPRYEEQCTGTTPDIIRRLLS